MIISITSGELKMVVILATALALGVGAAAACVVPWFYCKPKNDGDDEREAAANEDSSGSISRSRSINEENSSSTLGIRIHGLRGFNFVRVVIPRECFTSNTSGISATGENAAGNPTLHAFCRENSVNDRLSLPVHKSKLESTNFESGIFVDSRKKDGRYSERDFVHLESSNSGLKHTTTLSPRSKNSGIFNHRSMNLVSSHLRLTSLRPLASGLLPVIEENPSSKESSNLSSTDESSKKPASRTMPCKKSQRTNEISRAKTVDIGTTAASSKSTNHTNESTELTIKTRRFHESRETSDVARQSEFNVPAIVPPCESSNYTDESTELTKMTSSFQESRDTGATAEENEVNVSTSGVQSESSNHTDESKDLTDKTSSSHESKDTSATLGENVVSISRNAAPSDSSNTDESSTETTGQISTSQESDNSSSPPKIPKSTTVETPKVAGCLETINEISACPETSLEGPSQKSSLNKRLTSNERGNFRFNENLSTSIKAGNSNFIKARSNAVTPMANSSFDESSDSIKSAPCDKERGKKSSKRSHYTMALSDGLKRVWRRIKFDKTPQTPRGIDQQQSCVESVQSLSAGAKIPTGHSTLHEPTKSMISNQNSSQSFHDPCVKKLVDLEMTDESYRSRIEIDEEPLDLSIRFSSDVHKNDENSSPLSRKSYGCTRGFSREVFREVADFLRVRRVSVSSEDGAARSGSIEFYGDSTESCSRDENENLTSDYSNVDVNLKMENRPRFDENQEGNRLESSTCVKEKKFSQKIRKMFNLHNKIGDEFVTSGKGEKNLENVTVEFQRDLTETRLTGENDPDSRDSRNSESPDISSYLDLGFTVSGDENNVPCTEL